MTVKKKAAPKTTKFEAIKEGQNPNMELWESVEKTDPDRTKYVQYGSHHFTAINATYQIKLATAQWGPYGSMWGVQNQKFLYRKIEGIYACDYEAEFYCPISRFNINTSIQYFKDGKFDSDYRKKVETDALTKALSRLGFNADVFMGMFDDNKYVDQLVKDKMAESVELDPQDVEDLIQYIKNEDGLEYVALMESHEIEYKLALGKEYGKTVQKGQKVKDKERRQSIRAKGTDQMGKLITDLAAWLADNNTDAVQEAMDECSPRLQEYLRTKVIGL